MDEKVHDTTIDSRAALFVFFRNGTDKRLSLGQCLTSDLQAISVPGAVQLSESESWDNELIFEY
jgi:hypothetical protein